MSSHPERIRARLALADGLIMEGFSFGARGEAGGELCFNTSAVGYQEIQTDPASRGQIMVMAYPHIGNCGAEQAGSEADAPHVAGFVVRSYTPEFSSASAESSLDAYMERHGLVGITGVDTRRLVRHLRENGAMNAIISTEESDGAALVEKARHLPAMDGLELASRVTTREAYDFHAGDGPRIAVYDFGVKRSILRSFAGLGCTVRVFPAHTPLADVLDWQPDGFCFSSGPGDPRAMPDAIEMVKAAMRTSIPSFGIGLGHQLMALAAGMEVDKMHVGHRGINQPVKNLRSGRVEVTTQSHGFSVRGESISNGVAEVSHVNLNDGSVEGLRYARALSVQYHPEASPGPRDSHYLFGEFLELIGVPAREAAEVSRA